MRRSLHEMVTVITGASAGIGRALATELSRQRGKLVLGREGSIVSRTSPGSFRAKPPVCRSTSPAPARAGG